IMGDLVIDDTAFGEGAYLPPGFEQKLEPNSFRSPIGAVSINLNAVRVVVEPGAKSGDPARVRLVPPNDHVRLQVEATTTSGAKRRLKVDSTGTQGGTTITVTGSIGTGSRELSVVRRIDEPAQFAGAVLARALADIGIMFHGTVRRGLAPKGGTIVVTHTSEPMAYLMAVMNKWSSNFMAEMTLRALSTTEDAGEDKGTWAGGKRALDACLQSLGVDTAGVQMLNGSGLYTGNEYSPRHVTSLLTTMDTHRWAPEFKASLAIAGVDGTLARRFKGTSAAGNLRAKTGTLNEVTALSGYVITKKGRRVAFSILFNDTPIKSWRLRDIQDAVARAIADSAE
ncbi:MAG: D-alanyl-D-alanine carboxypeptidase/D-alanyl-D-alanine-endopeptidase, partial [Myxococcota bacterium]